MIESIALYTPEADFVRPYVKAALPGVAIHDFCDDMPAVDMALMVSSTDIYGQHPPLQADEDTPVDNSSSWAIREHNFRHAAEAMHLVPVILRCPDIVATGMTGFPRKLAEAVYRAIYYKFPGNEARRSVVHATDIGRVAAALASGGLPKTAGRDVPIYNLTDGTYPLIDELAESFAFRMGNKRISTLSTGPQQWFGRKVYGARRYAEYTTSRTFSSARIAFDLAFRPTDVCAYLRTHIYDENSL